MDREDKPLVDRLREEIHRLKRENKKLRSDIRTFNSAFRKTAKFLRDSTDEFDVEEVIEAAKRDNSLEELREKRK